MAVKVNKSKTQYKVDLSKAEKPTTVIITGVDEISESLDNEQTYAYRDVDSSEQFQVLKEVGLSPLKAVVLANTEFIPIGTGQENAANVIKVDLGEDRGAVAVNNVARLMVLHRQIRAVTLKSGNKILNETKDFDVHQFYRISRKIIKNKYASIVANQKTIDGTIDRTIKVLQDAPSRIVKRITGARKSNPFFRTLIEYMIHEILIIDIIQYLSGLQSLRKFLKNNYSIANVAQSTQAFRDSVSAFQLQNSDINIGLDEFLGTYETDFRNFAGSKSSFIGEEKKSALLDLIAENSLNISQDTQGSDAPGGYIMMTQAGLSAIRNVSCYQSLVSEIGNASKFDAKPTRGKCWNYNSTNDLCRAMFMMRSTSLFAMAHTGTPEPPSTDNPAYATITNLHSKLATSKYTHARGAISETRDTSVANEKRRTWAELLVASIFDTTYSIQKHHLLESKKTKALRQLGNNSTSSPMGVKQYFQEMYGDLADEMIFNPDLSYTDEATQNITALRTETAKLINVPDPALNPNKSLGLFMSELNKARTQNGKRYIPFEDTEGLYSSRHQLTGPQYFIDHALQSGDVSLEAANNFIEEYKLFGLNYYNDIVNLTGVKYVEQVFEEICADLANEFESASSSTYSYSNSLFHLALLLSDTTENMKDLYNSAYFGSQLGVSATPGRQFTREVTIGVTQQELEVGDNSVIYPIRTKKIDKTRRSRYGPSSDISMHENMILDEGGQRSTRKASSAVFRQFLIGEFGISSHSLNVPLAAVSKFIDSEDTDSSNTSFADSKVFVGPDGEHYSGLNGEKYTIFDFEFSRIDSKRLSSGGNIGERGKLQLDKAADIVGGDPPPPPSAKEKTITNEEAGLCTYEIKRFNGGDGSMSPEQFSIDRGIRFSFSPMSSFTNFLNLKHFSCIIQKQVGHLQNATSALNRAKTKTAKVEPGGGVSINSVVPTHKPSGPINVLAEQSLGEFFELGRHQRGEIFFGWVQSILKKSITLYGASNNPEGERNAKNHILGNKFELQGVANAFKRAANRLDLSDLKEYDIKIINDNGSMSGKNLANEHGSTRRAAAQGAIYTADHLNMVRNMISKRKRRILSSAMIFYLHALHLEQSIKKARRYTKGDTAMPSSAVMQNTLRETADFAELLTMTSPESIEQILNAHVNTFVSLPTKLFTPEDQLFQRKYNLAFKLLTRPGYGLLSSEKKGNKTVLHVGITNSMMEVMRLNAFQETGNEKFLNSTNVCINVFKKNELNASESVYPKVFAFDTGKYIHDFDFRGKMHNHLENFNLDWSFNEVLNNLVVTRYTKAQGHKRKNNKFSDDYRIVSFAQKEANEAGRIPQDVLINHAFDYALKTYYKLSTGIDFGEYNFPLDNDLSEMSGQGGGLGRASADMQADFDSLITQVQSIYPAANVDDDLAQFLFKNFETIGNNPVYTLKKRLKRVIQPKKFDRVFSILVNDKDFIIHPDSANKEFSEIYKQSPNFNLTSKITRRGPFRHNAGTSKENKNNKPRWMAPNSKANRSVLENYKKSCREDAAEIYSYYVTVSLLTDDAHSPEIFESTTKVDLKQSTAEKVSSEFAKNKF